MVHQGRMVQIYKGMSLQIKICADSMGSLQYMTSECMGNLKSSKEKVTVGCHQIGGQ